MPTRPHPADPTPGASTASPAGSAFAGLGAGLDFFQDWLKAAGSALPHLQGTQGGSTPSWSLPTLDPDELDKRIQDLRTVQFWLEQNARMIAMTIQGLEVQKMTLTTLKGMNVSMDAVRDALRARAPSTPPAAATRTPAEPPAAASAGRDDPAAPDSDDASTGSEASDGLVNPMRWWDTLTQQFTHLASQTAQTAAQTAQSMGESMGASVNELLQQAQQTGAQPAQRKPAPRKKAAPPAAGQRSKAAAAKRTKTSTTQTARSAK